MIENYIACDTETRSEIVIPCFIGKEMKLRTVFDLDSPNIGEFSEEDEKGLKRLLSNIYTV